MPASLPRSFLLTPPCDGRARHAAPCPRLDHNRFVMSALHSCLPRGQLAAPPRDLCCRLWCARTCCVTFCTAGCSLSTLQNNHPATLLSLLSSPSSEKLCVIALPTANLSLSHNIPLVTPAGSTLCLCSLFQEPRWKPNKVPCTGGAAQAWHIRGAIGRGGGRGTGAHGCCDACAWEGRGCLVP